MRKFAEGAALRIRGRERMKKSPVDNLSLENPVTAEAPRAGAAN